MESKIKKRKNKLPTPEEKQRLIKLYVERSDIEDTMKESPYSYIVFSPNKIRSWFAKFDPTKRESSRISAAKGGRVDMRDGGFVRSK